MDRWTGIRVASLVLLLSVIVAACGQKPGVHQPDTFAIGSPGGGGLTPIDGGGDGGDGGPIDPLDPNVPGGGGDGGPGGGDGGGNNGGGNAAGSRIGITDDKIVIGIHAPLTGAAPIDPAAFRSTSDVYWKYLHNDLKKKIHGRTVEVIVEDDNYRPSVAVQKCDTMSRKAFLLIGGAGTDQINNCAGFADARVVPYVSAGVQETGLSNRRTYFAVSMSYAQQMPLLVQLLNKENTNNRFGSKYGPAKVKVGYIRPNTANFNDSDAALKKAVLARNWDYQVYTVVKEGNTTEAGQVARRLQEDDVDIVVPITAPVFTLQLAGNTGGNNYFPLFAGVGISNNVNQMINQACQRNQFDGALFLSPWPGWKNVMMDKKLDPDFKPAAQKYAGGVNTRDGGGDLVLALWGIMKSVHAMLEAAGPDLTRESFLQDMQNFTNQTSFFPKLDYKKSRPFGAQDANVLIGSCGDPGAPSQGVQAGHQWITFDKYKGLRSSF